MQCMLLQLSYDCWEHRLSSNNNLSREFDFPIQIGYVNILPQMNVPN